MDGSLYSGKDRYPIAFGVLAHKPLTQSKGVIMVLQGNCGGENILTSSVVSAYREVD